MIGVFDYIVDNLIIPASEVSPFIAVMCTVAIPFEMVFVFAIGIGLLIGGVP